MEGRPLILLSCRQDSHAAYPGIKWSEQPLFPAWPCTGWGLRGCPRCREHRWSLTPPFHPYPARMRVPGGCFLSPYPSDYSALRLGGTLLCGARTFLMTNGLRPVPFNRYGKSRPSITRPPHPPVLFLRISSCQKDIYQHTTNIFVLGTAMRSSRNYTHAKDFGNLPSLSKSGARILF